MHTLGLHRILADRFTERSLKMEVVTNFGLRPVSSKLLRVWLGAKKGGYLLTPAPYSASVDVNKA